MNKNEDDSTINTHTKEITPIQCYSFTSLNQSYDSKIRKEYCSFEKWLNRGTEILSFGQE